MRRDWLPALPRWLGGKPRRGAHVSPGPGATLDLRFANGVAQSRMHPDAPEFLTVDYTRTMLAALLWQPAPERIGIVGLGGGSQAKFLHRYLPQAEIEALEISRDVLAFRDRFQVPPDSERFRVLQVDAAEFLPAHADRYDLMLVDAYDETGLPAAVSTPGFHRACRGALTGDGVLSSNLFCADHAAHFVRLRDAFDGQAVIMEEERQSNRVAFAWNGPFVPCLHPPGEVLAGMPAAAATQLRPGFERLAAALPQRAPSDGSG